MQDWFLKICMSWNNIRYKLQITDSVCRLDQNRLRDDGVCDMVECLKFNITLTKLRYNMYNVVVIDLECSASSLPL